MASSSDDSVAEWLLLRWRGWGFGLFFYVFAVVDDARGGAEEFVVCVADDGADVDVL